VITGVVSSRYALVPLRVQSAEGTERELEFVLDTGFVGYLSLPPAAIGALALDYAHRMPIALADGTWTVVELYRASIDWEGIDMDVEVLSMGTEPLLGTSLLDGCEVSIHFTDGRLVTIEPT
jgi:clan AA aspartic protease